MRRAAWCCILRLRLSLRLRSGLRSNVTDTEKEPDSDRPIKRSMWPKPGTAEAKALGCKCDVIERADGKISYAFTKGCPVPNHRQFIEANVKTFPCPNVITCDKGHYHTYARPRHSSQLSRNRFSCLRHCGKQQFPADEE